jgi:hypothetical protein
MIGITPKHERDLREWDRKLKVGVVAEHELTRLAHLAAGSISRAILTVRKRKEKRGALARLGGNPDPAAIPRDDLLAGGKADPASGAIIAVKPLERLEIPRTSRHCPSCAGSAIHRAHGGRDRRSVERHPHLAEPCGQVAQTPLKEFNIILLCLSP